MPDKFEPIILTALARLAAAPQGLPLFGSRSSPGLFVRNALGKRAVELCRQQVFLETVRAERRGKTDVEVCRLSSAGIDYIAVRLESLRAPEPDALARAGASGSVLAHLRQRELRGAIQDCSLPDLLKVARSADKSLSIGEFHDGLRTLHEREHIYLHPWTGPLYELPQPEVALLVGHEIIYYASARTPACETDGRSRDERSPLAEVLS